MHTNEDIKALLSSLKHRPPPTPKDLEISVFPIQAADSNAAKAALQRHLTPDNIRIAREALAVHNRKPLPYIGPSREQPPIPCGISLTIPVITTVHHTRTEAEVWVEVEITKHDFFGAVIQVARLPIKRDELRQNLVRRINERYPHFLTGDIANDVDKQAAHAYGEALKFAKKQHSFHFSGWHEDPVSGQLVFLNNAMPYVHSNLRLLENRSLAAMFMNSYLDIATERSYGALIITCLFAAHGPFSIFYEKAGIPAQSLRCLLFLHATTGSGKTTLVRVFADALVEKAGSNILRFEDTIASLQEHIALSSQDSFTVVDDFFPQSNPSAEAAFLSKLGEIARISGDNRIKGKMGPDRKPLADRLFRGILCVTGEYVQLNSHSSYLRSWFVHLEHGSLNFQSAGLRALSNNNIARAFLSSWIAFLRDNQAKVINELPALAQATLSSVREKFPTCQYERALMNVNALCVIAHYFSQFLNELGNNTLSENMLLNVIFTEAQKQMAFLEDISPESVFKSALRDGIENGGLRLSPDEATFLSDENSDGYSNDDALYLITGKAEAQIASFCRRKGLGLKLTPDLKASLIRRGIILPSSKGEPSRKYTRNRTVQPKRPRLYVLTPEIAK